MNDYTYMYLILDTTIIFTIIIFILCMHRSWTCALFTAPIAYSCWCRYAGQ